MAWKHRKASNLLILIQWVLVGLWTVVFFFLMVWPSAGTPVADVSSWFGGTTLTDAFGHVVLFWIEAMLLYRVLCRYIGERRALLLVVFGGLLLGALLELIQHWVPARGSTWMDFSANCLGIGLFFWSERWGQQRTHY